MRPYRSDLGYLVECLIKGMLFYYKNGHFLLIPNLPPLSIDWPCLTTNPQSKHNFLIRPLVGPQNFVSFFFCSSDSIFRWLDFTSPSSRPKHLQQPGATKSDQERPRATTSDQRIFEPVWVPTRSDQERPELFFWGGFG